jgi:hypothetical protein
MLSDLIEKLALSLEGDEIDYMIIGGQAVLVFGEPRMTRDIDITVGLGPEDLARIICITEMADLKILPEEPEKFVQRTMVLPCADEKTGIRVDIIFSNSAYESQAFKRVHRIKVGNAKVCFASPEDVVIHKVIAGRPRDLEDAKGILAKQSMLDYEYIRSWLARFDQALDTNHLDSFESL